MLKIVKNIPEEFHDDETEEASRLILDNSFLRNIPKGKKLLLRNFDGSNQFMIEIMNNKKPKKSEIEHDPFRRSVYARGYQGFLTHEEGKAKLIFDDKNWITFDLASFAL
jgi:hypothetical protein